MDSSQKYKAISIQEIKGVNERRALANSDLGELDILRGGVPTTQGTLTKINGIKRIQSLGNVPIYAIFQTNNRRQTILVQTRDSLIEYTSEEFFNKAIYIPTLSYSSQTEEENMSQAIIVHQLPISTAGGTYTTANLWQQAPLTSIISQVNPDGTAAAFVTLASNQFQLASGVYRIRGYSVMSHATNNVRMAARLYNVTAGQPAWNGLGNENSEAFISPVDQNSKCWIGGVLNLAGPTTFEIQGLIQRAQTNSGFGAASYTITAPAFTSLAKELYRYLEILKTA